MDIPLPPENLRFRVGGDNNPDLFLQIGKQEVADIHKALARIDRRFESFPTVLDFGCGPGRTLRWLGGINIQLYGCDVDRESIEWCRINIPFARCSVNPPLPSTTYPDRFFSLVYAFSVFTHLREDYQDAWLTELKRITARGGIVLVTTLGPTTWHEMDNAYLERLYRDGYLFSTNQGEMTKLFPDYYGIAFHTLEYVKEHFGRYFKVLLQLPRALNNHQDMVVMERV